MVSALHISKRPPNRLSQMLCNNLLIRRPLIEVDLDELGNSLEAEWPAVVRKAAHDAHGHVVQLGETLSLGFISLCFLLDSAAGRSSSRCRMRLPDRARPRARTHQAGFFEVSL